MDENFEKKRSEIDLTSFDLTPFKEYFEEEDAQKAAEKKAREEQIIKEETEKAAAAKAEKELILEEKRKKELAEAQAAARLKAEKEAAREREEARRAAEKAAEAALAAKRAEEAKQKANMEKSAKLLECVPEDDVVIPQSVKVEESEDEKIDSISSILSIENNENEDENPAEDSTELADEYFNYVSDVPSLKSKIYTAVCAILVIAFLGCAGFAGYTYFFSGKAKAEPSNLEYIGKSPEYAPFGDLQAKYINLESGPANTQLRAAYAQNSETVGWISIKGTPVDYPIVKASDNMKYLSYTNFYGKGARYGTPFMDFRCNAEAMSKNTVIYAHHMNNNLFFGSLDKYENSNYYKEHPVIEYQTLNGALKYKIYAVFYATTQADCDGGFVFDYYNPNMSDENFKGYIELLNQYAIYTTDTGLEATDKIITLSTCTHVYDDLKKGGVDTRLVVVGRLLREGEDEKTDGKTVNENSDYRRPQLWYDANQKENPYAAYRTWRASL